MGFDATAFNYNNGYCGYAAHTIGHREITINDTGDNNNDNNGTDAFINDTDSLSYRNLSGSGFNNGEIIRNSIEPIGSISEIDETLSETESDDNSRTLIVVSIRGSVTPLDWAMDFASQIDLEGANFEAGCREIMESLDAYKTSYKDEINNPIILVTGHSLGAAVANLVAVKLNEKVNQGDIQADVYAYTFDVSVKMNGI